MIQVGGSQVVPTYSAHYILYYLSFLIYNLNSRIIITPFVWLQLWSSVISQTLRFYRRPCVPSLWLFQKFCFYNFILCKLILMVKNHSFLKILNNNFFLVRSICEIRWIQDLTNTVILQHIFTFRVGNLKLN